jgi:hypothetical protein
MSILVVRNREPLSNSSLLTYYPVLFLAVSISQIPGGDEESAQELRMGGYAEDIAG